jgi:hypothetical protein
MFLASAQNFVIGSTHALVAAKQRPIIGLGVGSLTEGPIDAVDEHEFAVVAYVAKLTVEVEHEARRFCEHLANSTDFPLPVWDVRIVEAGDSFRPLAFTGSEHGNIQSLNTRKWFKSLRPGIGICNPTRDHPTVAEPYDLRAGTAGFFVANESGDHYVVSCNHVIARTSIRGDHRRLIRGEAEPVVQKVGRTTGYTEGYVSEIAVIVPDIEYDG